MELYCIQCGHKLEKNGDDFACPKDGVQYHNSKGVLVERGVEQVKDTGTYNQIYRSGHGSDWVQGLNRSFLKKILEHISLSYRRERFFKSELQGKDNSILDLACGAGRDYFKNYGKVVGVDLVRAPLDVCKERYDLVLQADASHLPFADNTFDYVVSSDFFGHVPLELKDTIIREIYRVLKPGGKTLHVIETDSKNIWFKIAHQKPELFQKYFIDQIGGHVGLEMPSACVERWQKNEFTITKKKKIWGTIWPIRDYSSVFNNEFKSAFPWLRPVVAVSSLFTRFKLIEVGFNIILNPINSLVESLTPIDNGQGLMLAAKK